MRLWCGTILLATLQFSAFGAATLSTGVEIPDDGAPTWEGGMQYTTRTERRPAAITNEADYLKWKWRMNLANPATGLDNDALRDGVKKIVAESGWKDGKEDWYDVAARCFDFLVDNVAIGFSKYDCFPAISAWERHSRPMSAVLWKHAADVDRKYSPGLGEEIWKMEREGRATIRKDFDHSAPDWEDILKLGFPGMKARADSYAEDTPFYRAERRAAAGDKGLRAFRILVEQFFAGGGVAMNINIVSPETLRDAQKHPEKYENLQVRVAGWNIRWNDIPRKEQDEYIARIETVGGSL